MESSLTTPNDRDKDNKYKPDKSFRELNKDELDKATKELNVDLSTDFPKVERIYLDPPVPLQNIGLFSFIPSQEAKPDKDGFFGFIKLRGNYNTIEDSSDRAEFLIKNYDSYHQIFHAHVGRPVPITVSSDYSYDIKKIDLKDKMKNVVSSNIKSKKDEERNSIKEIQEREQALLDKSKAEELTGETGIDLYTTLRVKKAQLSWTFLETLNKLRDEVVPALQKTIKEIDDLDVDNPDFKNLYYDKYSKARKEAGIPDGNIENNFMKYMVEDAILQFSNIDLSVSTKKEKSVNDSTTDSTTTSVNDSTTDSVTDSVNDSVNDSTTDSTTTQNSTKKKKKKHHKVENNEKNVD